MGVVWFVIQLIVVGLYTFYTWNKYVNWRKQHVLVSISTYIGWYFSFLIILVLPLDVAITFYNKCQLDEKRVINETHGEGFMCEEPKGHLSDDFLFNWWRIVYWTSQLLTWIVLPIMQSYTKGGSFTTIGRLKFAIYNNAIYYGIYLILFVFFLFYAISKGVSLNFDHLKVLIISASNTWGFLFLVVLLGYGLVEVPAKLYSCSNKVQRLDKTYFEIAKLAGEKSDAEDTVSEMYHECREVLNLLKSIRGSARSRIQDIISQFPDEIVEKVNNRRQISFSTQSLKNVDAQQASEELFLVRLNRRTNSAVQNFRRTQAQWNALIKKAGYLQDVIWAESNRKLPELEGDAWLKKYVSEELLYHWHVTIKWHLFRILAILCFGMTILIMWSECTFFVVKPQLSLAARILHSLALGYHYKYIQVTAITLILYLGVCAYYTVFYMKIYKYYHLDSNKMTDANSMVFSAMLLCRLTPPLCLNFLGMIHLDSHITASTKFGVETQFTKLMGHLDVLPMVASGINIYLPVLIVILCLSTWFKLGTRLLHNIGIDQFMDDDEVTSDLIQSGKAFMTLERRQKPVMNKSYKEVKKTVKDDEVNLLESGYNYEPDTVNLLSDSLPDNVPSASSWSQASHPKSTDIFDDL